MDDDEHYAFNRAWWDERAPAHADSPDYAVQELIADPTRLSDVVRFDLPRLGDINGQRGFICNAISARTRSHCTASAPP